MITVEMFETMLWGGAALAAWLALGAVVMHKADARTGYALSDDLIYQRCYLSQAGVFFWLAMLWPAGLIWYWRRWR